MSDLVVFNPSRALDGNVKAVPGALAYFYDTGTSNPRTVYADPELTVPHASPLVADSVGIFPEVFVAGDAVRAVVQRANGVTLYDLDPALKVPSGGAGAGTISFTPTVDIPVTNVQAAIERVQANIVSPLAAFGLGVTGSSVLLSNLDASNIASGAYRYAGTTTGTFPSGVAAADSGIVETWRETSGVSIQLLYPETSDRVFLRRYVGTWQPWVEFLLASRLATQAEAEAGTNNLKLMTPLRSQQQFAKRVFPNGNTTDVTASRALATNYQNTTNGWLFVSVTCSNNGQTLFVGPTIATMQPMVSTNIAGGSVGGFIPPGAYYRVTGSGLTAWFEG